MHSTSSSYPFALLKALAPPQTLIHVGAGLGQGPLHQWHGWGINQVWVVEADAARLAWAEPLAAAQPGWHVCAALLADVDGTVSFHRASNPAEDGLLAAEPLRALWPNLRATGEEQRAAQRLDALLGTQLADAPPQSSTWLLVDCLPALPVLQGAANTLAQCAVIAVRTLLQPLAGVVPGAALPALEGYLAAKGFKLVETLEGHQPAIGHAVFVRDWPAALQKQADVLAAQVEESQVALARHAEATAQIDRLRQQRTKLITDYDQLARARDQVQTERDAQAEAVIQALAQRDAETAAKKEAIAQREGLAQEKAGLAEEIATLTAALNQARQERDAQAEAVAQALAQRDAEAAAKAYALAARDAETAAKQEAVTKLEALSNERNQLVVTRDEQAHIATQRLQQLEAQAQEHAYRHQLQQEEMLKAEAQIELIKDLLLREPGL